MGVGGEDGGVAVERAHNGSWWGTQTFSDERIDTSDDIFILLKKYQQQFSSRIVVDILLTYQQGFLLRTNVDDGLSEAVHN
jgi:hypothetical protein